MMNKKIHFGVLHQSVTLRYVSYSHKTKVIRQNKQTNNNNHFVFLYSIMMTKYLSYYQKFFNANTSAAALLLIKFLLLVIFCGSSSSNTIVEAAKATSTSYYADFGGYGFMSLEISNDEGLMNYNIELVGINDLFQSNQAGYHFHSGLIGDGKEYGAGDTAADLCGASNTFGHYDPTLKCGSASSAPLCFDVTTTTSECCLFKPLENYCSDDNKEGTCEIGDLSGRFGKLTINNDGTASTTVEDAACPNCIDDYLLNQPGTEASYKTWAGIVFHDSIDDGSSPRVLCGNLVIVNEDDKKDALGNGSSSSSASRTTLFVVMMMYVVVLLV